MTTVLTILIGCYILYFVFMNIYSAFDHCGWDTDSNPDPNAKIIDISSKEVQYAKNGVKYKTTVKFSDGFYFVTYKTDRKDKLFTYQISIDQQLYDKIISKAVQKHLEAIKKRF